MAVNLPVPWLIAYDIGDKRRLAHLHRFLCGHATPVQYSVFLARTSASQMGGLVKDIEERIDQREDDVRIYRIPEPTEAFVQGRCMLPDGILLLSSGRDLIRPERCEKGS
jgi:CRISPR-associated protein Cas2